MHGMRLRGLLLGGCLLAITLVSGCFQAAGNTLPATSVAQGIATFTRTPTLPPPPSETPTPGSAEATEEVLDSFDAGNRRVGASAAASGDRTRRRQLRASA